MSHLCHRSIRNLAPAMILLAWGLSAPEAVATPAPDEQTASRADHCFLVHGERLEELVAIMNRYNEHQLLIVDPVIRRYRVGGRVCPGRLPSFIRGLRCLGVSAVDGDSDITRGVTRLARTQRAAGPER